MLLLRLTEETVFLSAQHISHPPLEHLCDALTMRDETNQKLENIIFNAVETRELCALSVPA